MHRLRKKYTARGNFFPVEAHLHPGVTLILEETEAFFSSRWTSSLSVSRQSVTAACKSTSTCRRLKTRLNPDWISLNFWETGYPASAKRNLKTSTTPNSGAGRLHLNTVCPTHPVCFVSNSLFFLCSQRRNKRSQLLQSSPCACEIQQSPDKAGTSLH